MYSKIKDCKFFCPSMGSIDGSSQLKAKRVELLEELPQGSNTSENSTMENHDGHHYVDDSCPSDCESGVSGPERQKRSRVSPNDSEAIYDSIKRRLMSSLSSYGFNDAQVVSIHRNDYSGIMSRARLQSFIIHSKAMALKFGGNANVKYAWYGASKNEIDRIISYGFGFPMNSQTHGQGIYLSPVDNPIESLQSSNSDEDGVRHMLLCRLILGKTEIVCPGSKQCNPSSAEFDSGIDSLVSPKKYIIWCSRMNSHILPEFIVSFRASSSSGGYQMPSQPARKPKSDWMPFASLITALSKYIPPDATQLITKFYRDYKSKTITRNEMIQRVRHIAGDKLLMAVIKKYRGKVAFISTNERVL